MTCASTRRRSRSPTASTPRSRVVVRASPPCIAARSHRGTHEHTASPACAAYASSATRPSCGGNPLVGAWGSPPHELRRAGRAAGLRAHPHELPHRLLVRLRERALHRAVRLLSWRFFFLAATRPVSASSRKSGHAHKTTHAAVVATMPICGRVYARRYRLSRDVAGRCERAVWPARFFPLVSMPTARPREAAKARASEG